MLRLALLKADSVPPADGEVSCITSCPCCIIDVRSVSLSAMSDLLKPDAFAGPDLIGLLVFTVIISLYELHHESLNCRPD